MRYALIGDYYAFDGDGGDELCTGDGNRSAVGRCSMRLDSLFRNLLEFRDRDRVQSHTLLRPTLPLQHVARYIFHLLLLNFAVVRGVSVWALGSEHLPNHLAYVTLCIKRL